MGLMMKDRVFIISLLMFVLIVSFHGCDLDKEKAIPEASDGSEYPSQEGWNSKIYISNAGRLQAKVHYGHMIKYDSQKLYLFDEGVEIDFYDVEGNHTSHLISERGEYFETTEDVIGKGNVVVVSDSGLTLRTEELRWNNRREKIISDTLIMLTTPEHDTLYGMGFESNADLSHRVIHKPWGKSEKRIDLEKLDESFSKPSPADTSMTPDSTRIEIK